MFINLLEPLQTNLRISKKHTDTWTAKVRQMVDSQLTVTISEEKPSPGTGRETQLLK